MSRIALVVALVLVSVVTGPGVARADAPHTTPHTTPPPPPPPPPPAPWRDMYHQGSVAYDAGRLDEALRDFQQARSLGGPPSLIYDIALTLDRLGRTQEAIAAYHQYLDASPDASNRDVVEARLGELQPPSGVATHVAPPSSPILALVTPDVSATTTTTTTTTTGDAYLATHPVATGDHWVQQGPEWVASWVMLALTAATSVSAVIVWQDGIGRFQQLRDLCDSMLGCTQTDIDASPAHTSQDVANALLGISIGLGAITVLTFVIEGVVSGNRMRFVRGASRDEGPRFSLGPLGFSLSGTF